MRRALPKVLYGFFFVAILPLALSLWAHGARDAIHLAAIQSAPWGLAATATGIVVALLGMLALWTYGGGLPMNAFPPPRFVDRGIYLFIPHPIYFGFTLACAGVSIHFGSASGLCLVTPFVALASAALVLGYEMPDLRRRFGAQAAATWPCSDSSEQPSILERFRVYLLVLLPWLLVYGAIWHMGRAPDAVGSYLDFESHWPVVEWTELTYASTYLIVLLVPLLLRTRRNLRRFAGNAWAAMALMFPLYLLLPVYVPPRPFVPATVFGHLLQLERTPYSGVAAFPSFHILWALIAASALAADRRRYRIFWFAWAALVAVSCVTTGMHSILDVLAGAAVFPLIVYRGRIWSAILFAAERIANSWKEWRIGPVRIINHGGYAALAAFVGMAIIGAFLGPQQMPAAVSIFVFAILGAVMWAQWVEGSPALLRPMGFYGGVIGSAIGAIPALWMGVSFWAAVTAVCVAAPWIQSIGRLRCLVQGCCHGHATETVEGIRYTHPRTRVWRLTDFKGIPIHATQVYSILWNVLIGVALVRLIVLHSPATFVFGFYFLFSGLGRFVEEAYRGEPQTKVLWGLRLYQWIAVVTVVAGAVATTVPSAPMPQVSGLNFGSFALAVGCSALTWFVSGIDFPESSRRFARLT
jgi:membrane-associated phospholipid phosphatase/protein-S-isoprenylcysteine O-methyltransferase Ste14